MKTVRDETVRQDNLVLTGGIKESVKEKCRGLQKITTVRGP